MAWANLSEDLAEELGQSAVSRKELKEGYVWSRHDAWLDWEAFRLAYDGPKRAPRGSQSRQQYLDACAQKRAQKVLQGPSEARKAWERFYRKNKPRPEAAKLKHKAANLGWWDANKDRINKERREKYAKAKKDRESATIPLSSEPGNRETGPGPGNAGQPTGTK